MASPRTSRIPAPGSGARIRTLSPPRRSISCVEALPISTGCDDIQGSARDHSTESLQGHNPLRLLPRLYLARRVAVHLLPVHQGIGMDARPHASLYELRLEHARHSGLYPGLVLNMCLAR